MRNWLTAIFFNMGGRDLRLKCVRIVGISAIRPPP